MKLLDFNGNVLSDDKSKWKLQNAIMDQDTIELNSNAVVTSSILYDSFSYVPEYLRSIITFKTQQKMKDNSPIFWIKVSIYYADDTIQDFLLWPNQLSVVGINTWQFYTDFSIKQKDFKYVIYSILTEALSSVITVTQWELRGSVALSASMLSSIESQLPSILYFGNTSLLTIGQTAVICLNAAFQLGASTNLLVHFILSGVASEDCCITISFQINNKEVPYSPLKQNISAGDFTIGIPASLLQLALGNNMFMVLVTSSAGTLTIQPNHLYCTLDGKNIIGGYSAEVPHAEVIQYIPYEQIGRDYNIEHVADITLYTSGSTSVSQICPYQDIQKLFPIQMLPYVETTTVAISERYYNDQGATYAHDDYIVLDGNMHFKSSVIDTTFTPISETTDGSIYCLSLDNTSVKNYEAFTITPITQTVVKTYEQIMGNYQSSEQIELGKLSIIIGSSIDIQLSAENSIDIGQYALYQPDETLFKQIISFE